MTARTQEEIRALQQQVLDGADPQTLRALAAAESFRAILAGRDQPRFARQQQIEAELVAFRPDLLEADDLLQAWFMGVQERYGESPRWTNFLFRVEQLQVALGALEHKEEPR